MKSFELVENMKKNIWIDTDLSVGMKRHGRPGYSDVDDGFAVLQLMKSSHVEIHGISAVFGNTQIDNAYTLCRYMSKAFASDHIPVFKGAGEAINVQNVFKNQGVEALAKALKDQKLTIVAIGPATNIGLLLLNYPGLAGQIEEIVLVAGRRKPTDYFAIGTQGLRARDFNFEMDNNAFELIFQFGLPVTLCPFEISHKVWLNQDDLDRFARGDAGCRWLADKSRAWLQQWLDQGAKGFNPFDVLASHYILEPDDIIAESLNTRIEIHQDDTVKDNESEVFKQYLLCDKGQGYPIKYCYDVVDGFHDKLLKTFGV